MKYLNLGIIIVFSLNLFGQSNEFPTKNAKWLYDVIIESADCSYNRIYYYKGDSILESNTYSKG